jgi:hypothetical protein
VHQPGERHFELLEAFASDPVLAKISEAFSKHSYRSHEFGDSLLIERGRGMRDVNRGSTNGISFLSLDPGDMDTPLHALAVPDADSDAHLPKARN